MKKPYRSYTIIDLAALQHNFTAIQSFCKGKKMLAVLKKDAYGHGIIEVAKTLEDQADYIGIASPKEGVKLRKAGIKVPILVIGAILPQEIAICIKYKLEFTLFSMAQLQEIRKIAPTLVEVHLKIDTGLGRIGIPWRQAESFIMQVKQLSFITIKGVFTHLACVDPPNDSFTNKQLSRFKSVVAIFKKNNWELPILHAAGSGGILDYPESHFDMVRPGHILYGVHLNDEVERKLGLKPVLSLYTTVLFSKRVKAGETIGYGNIFIAPKDTWVSVISIGYGDGYPKSLTGKGRILARGQSFPISSNVSMDQSIIVTGDTELTIGEEVVLIGSSGKQHISCEEIAKICHTLPGEILTSIQPAVHREITHKKNVKSCL